MRAVGAPLSYFNRLVSSAPHAVEYETTTLSSWSSMKFEVQHHGRLLVYSAAATPFGLHGTAIEVANSAM